MQRNKAKSEVQVDNQQVRITKYIFQPDDETGMHKHEYDYVITPIIGGNILLIDAKENKNDAILIASESYFRRAGVEHNVINKSSKVLIFVEIELKK
ncbi:MAG: Beta-alanine degradation protein BauB [Alphaproteobacteria bacterium MarineAlpha9_Bin4]|nr:cupin [Pelagibacterales bacterium]PPR25423.1 MAG: Beta-alanine degradation protein BauB [Alphaproteobacteria bacterium MarineAlpha9_Bin4]